jgi:DNA-binding NarL/FixJ family response regulator
VRSEVLSGAPDRAAAAHRRPHDDPRLIADDEALLRMAFSMFLEAQSDLAPVGEAEDGATAIRLAADPRPDVVLMDVRMPGTDGIEATRQIIQTCPQTRVLILTTFDLDEYAFAGLKAEALGLPVENTRPEELLTAIRTVAAGNAVVSPRITRRLLEKFRPRIPDAVATARDERLSRLSAREREVLVQVGSGLSNAEIAATLHLAEATRSPLSGQESATGGRHSCPVPLKPMAAKKPPRKRRWSSSGRRRGTVGQVAAGWLHSSAALPRATCSPYTRTLLAITSRHSFSSAIRATTCSWCSRSSSRRSASVSGPRRTRSANFRIVASGMPEARNFVQ